MTTTLQQQTDRHPSIETKAIHAGTPATRYAGAVSMPVFQSSIYEFAGETDYHSIPYIRLNNTPNHVALGEKLAAMENAEAALITGSGMAAIATSLLTVLSHGDHVLVQRRIYGGTHTFVTHALPQYGIAYDFIDGTDASGWAAKLRPNTKAIYVETISNPHVEVSDLRGVVEFARAHNLVSMVDNTVATPVNFRPAEHGFDLSLHSCTKYLNGHTDIVAGAVIGSAPLVKRVTHHLNHLGGCLDPHACHLLDRGVKTLAVRMRFQNESSMAIAEFLERHPRVRRVNYPGLPSSPSHGRAREWLEGSSGLLSFDVHGGVPEADRIIQQVTIPIHAPSLGGVETLISRPVALSHSGLAPEELEAMGLSESLIRLSVGLEATRDLIDDLEQALEA